MRGTFAPSCLMMHAVLMDGGNLHELVSVARVLVDPFMTEQAMDRSPPDPAATALPAQI